MSACVERACAVEEGFPDESGQVGYYLIPMRFVARDMPLTLVRVNLQQKVTMKNMIRSQGGIKVLSQREA